ncbi:MAG: hypothetical protein H0X24_00085 [Ktedonobacterales bacterium]|nr:hypothetical protein [Ktedonobacterales bacterium]
MQSLHILSARGDDCIHWNLASAARGSPRAATAVAEAEQVFVRAQAQGATAYCLDDPAHPQRLDAFEPTMGCIIIVPRLIGG